MMQIPPLRKGGESKVVLWDTATDTNYVRLSHAKKQRFPWKMETAVVSTVGGRVETKTLPVYECMIKNLVGMYRSVSSMITVQPPTTENYFSATDPALVLDLNNNLMLHFIRK